MKKEELLVALFDGKVLRSNRDHVELRMYAGQLQWRRIHGVIWEDTTDTGWCFKYFEIVVDPVDFMTAWKDMLNNGSKYIVKDFEDEGEFYIDRLDEVLMYKIHGRSPYKASMSKKLIEGEWCKV